LKVLGEVTYAELQSTVLGLAGEMGWTPPPTEENGQKKAPPRGSRGKRGGKKTKNKAAEGEGSAGAGAEKEAEKEKVREVEAAPAVEKEKAATDTDKGKGKGKKEKEPAPEDGDSGKMTKKTSNKKGRGVAAKKGENDEKDKAGKPKEGGAPGKAQSASLTKTGDEKATAAAPTAKKPSAKKKESKKEG
jgi:hypothetical protein